MRVLYLTGGGGGAKLAAGLASVLGEEELTVVCNTGDDFKHIGLKICPDLDSVMYSVSGLIDPVRGWGLAGETWTIHDTLASLGAPSWFRLGDRDLATHLLRTELLCKGLSLSSVTKKLCLSYGVRHCLLPMTDHDVQTVVVTEEGPLPFQSYFVEKRCEPRVRGFRYAGAESARANDAVISDLAGGAFDVIVIGPSNPYLSIDPILAIPGFSEEIRRARAPVVAVSPIVGGTALKGPAAKIMRELGVPPQPKSIAEHYGTLIDAMVLDREDRSESMAIQAIGCAVWEADSVMKSRNDASRLANRVLEAANALGKVGA